MFYRAGLLLLGIAANVLHAQINTPSGAVVPFNANPNYGTNGIMPTNLPAGGTYGKSQDAADAYNEWKANYTETCSNGIRVKFDEPNRTVSEGIAYGMLLAAYAADKNLFDGLWRYYKANSNGRGVMHWRIDGCSSVSGQNGATDAELDAAWALLIAETQWPTATSPYDYGAEANTLLNAVKQYEIASNGQAINGDGWGFGDPCRNPSYQSPAYYRTFATTNTSNASTWNNAVNGGYALINANANATTGLVSDWSNPEGVRNTCNPGGLGYAATDGFGYDACRNVWRMAQDALWNNDATAKGILGKITTWMATKGATGVGGPLYQNGSNYSGWAHNATFVSMFALAPMGTSNQTLLNSMYSEVRNTKDPIKNTTLSGYFGNTLRCVSLFMLTGNFWKYGTTSVQEINIRQGSINIANNATFDFQNAQTTPPASSGKALTFTIENLGFATLNLTGSTRVVLGGTNANQFSVTQPSASSLSLNQTTTFTVTFTPTSTGTKTATLTIASNDGDEGTYVINLVGTGTANATAPKMMVYDTLNLLSSGANIALGTFTNGAKGYKVFKVTNTGDAPLNITAANFGGTNASSFTMVDPANFTTALSIPVGGKAFVTVGYTAPATATNSSGTVTFSTNDPNAPSFLVNLTASSAACSNNPSTKVMMDYDGYKHLIQPWNPQGAWSVTATNPAKGPRNLSPTVASYVRPAAGAGTWDGNYDIIRYYNCGTSGTNYVSFAVSVNNPAIQVLMYSPAVGVEVTLAPQKPSGTSWLPLIPDYSSNVTVTTTKANQWEVLTFDMGKIIAEGVTADFKALDIQIDPTRKYASLSANSAVAARTFYIDEIKYAINPCVNDTSGVLQDFDDHNNVSLEYSNSSLTAPVVNNVSGGLNTSPNVGLFTKTKNTAAYDDGIRYVGCSNKIDLSKKKYISMLVYSSVANANIQLAAKVPDGADVDTYPDDAATSVQKTVFANKWHRIYFDLSAISVANLPNVYALDIFFDPEDLVANGSTFRFDDIRFESTLPCVSGIPATSILNDFDDNRYLNVAFPGPDATAPSFNTIAPNPSTLGNPSATVGAFLRATGTTTGTSFRFEACQNKLNLSPGNALIDLKVYSPNAGVKLIMSLKNTAGISLSDATETVVTANTWTKLTFDHSKVLNSTEVAFIDVIVDGDGTFSGATTTANQRTYYFDDLRYAEPAPEINIQALTTPTVTNILNTESFNMGSIFVGDSSIAVNFSIQNNGLQTLVLSGNPVLVKGGANPDDFVVTTTQTFTSSVGALGATGFTVKFKPTATGSRSASITVTSNDANEGTYVIYFNGTATCPVISAPTVGTTSYAYCTGSSASALTATASGGNTLYWHTAATGGTGSTTAPVPSTVAAGTTEYYVSQGTSAVCQSTRVKISVVVTAASTVNAGADQSNVEGPSVNLTAVANGNGKWTLVSGPITTVTFAPDDASLAVTANGLTALGTYQFAYTIAANGPCAAVSDNVSVEITTLTSAVETDLSKAVTIYPNPSSEVLNIEVNGVGEATVTVSDAYGHVVYSGNTSISAIPMADKAAGMYIVQIKTGNSVLTKTVFKK